MIHSMTAFARQSVQGTWGTACWEIRTVNHRYLDIYLKLPETLRELEPPVREAICAKLHRGKVDVFLKFQTEGGGQALTLNETLLDQLMSLAQPLRGEYDMLAPPSVLELLKWPGVVESEQVDTQSLHTDLLDGLTMALDEINLVRKREGAALSAYLLDHLKAIEFATAPLKAKIPAMLERQRELWQNRFAEAKLTLDSTRLEQEMLFFAQKIDVTEELDRLAVHIQEARRLLEGGGVIGRRLDFLMQELNREANTLASKSVDPGLSHAAVEIKVLIEQMREQIQNIE